MIFVHQEFGKRRLFGVLDWTKQIGYLNELNARILLVTDMPDKPRICPLYEMDLNDTPFLGLRYGPRSRRLVDTEVDEISSTDDDAANDEESRQWLHCRYLLVFLILVLVSN